MGFVVILSRQRWRESSLNTKRILETSKCDTIHATMTYRLTSFISTAVNTRSKRTMSLTGKRESFLPTAASKQQHRLRTKYRKWYRHKIYLPNLSTPPPKKNRVEKFEIPVGADMIRGQRPKRLFYFNLLNIKLKEKSNLTYCQNLQIIKFEMKSNYTPWKCVLTDLAE